AYEDLRQSYSAIFVGLRAHRGVRLDLPTGEAPNVLSALEFLQRVNAGIPFLIGKTAVVVGGGDVAVDAARLAIRLGAQTTLLFRKTVQEMPASAHEVEEARREGVAIVCPATPTAVGVENGLATGLTCLRLEPGEPDGAGLRPLNPVPGSEFFVKGETIIVAAKPERDFAGLASLRDASGRIPVDDLGETSVPNTFLAGDDLELGIVSTAILRGRRVAETMHARFRGMTPEAVPAPPVIAHDRMRLDYYPRQPRTETATLPVAERMAHPDREVDIGWSGDQAIAEAKRCLSCGLCFACDTCWKYCQEQAVVKPAAKGEPYRFKLEFCQGCKKCAEECPCGYIEMR
ncbi:MAG TPA: FAD-dependent oxidoreductase, partial [Candidatus Acidoferrum sp.]|nr:FAD-dependent oxidoreductase [Candidatus Acidoferrum sp.]